MVQAKSRQTKTQRQRTAGYCRALPKSALTPKASESRWALLAQGEIISRDRACSKLTAKPKAQLGDRRLMRDRANMNEADKLYDIPESCPKHGRGIEDLQPIFIELLRLALVKRSEAFELDRSGKLNAQEYRLMTRALKRGELTRVSEILQRALNSNQIG